ncbi:MAG: YraN family protein [Methylotenera sp.]|jgi:putative endonuclease|uniref:YraN family protein n=1 Tax=Methylotenera sp. TaxID=2051956 RepID=UPI00271E32FF|nr:YraN family protein [Methylotenera sp.]MDO9151594.1 YraN family protein [Methylotenera sp.]
MTEKSQAKHLTEGQAAEKIAATFLQKSGLRLLEKNYRCVHGEIDLIMRDGKTLVFVEVRLRSNSKFGGAGMSITPSKQQKLTRTAELYLQTNGDSACRFDAILMHALDITAVEWIRDAF